MKPAFKFAYERELQLLKERAAAFAIQHPGLAARLGGLLEENLDPSIAGLLEGTAFLAARVQLNIDQQFRVFSSAFLEQLSPDMTAPLPSAMMVEAHAPGKPEDLKKGRKIESGSYIEAAFTQDDQRVTCRYQLTEALTFWPIKVSAAEYFGAATPLSTLGCDALDSANVESSQTENGLALTLEKTDGAPIGDLLAAELPFHFAVPEKPAQALYSQIFANCHRVSLRWEDKFGTASFRRIPLTCIEQVGFDLLAPLFCRNEHSYPGFSMLLEYFAYAQKFMGFRLTGLAEHFKGITANSVQLIFEFSEENALLSTGFDREGIRLFCVPAVNLFEEEAKPVALDGRAHRYKLQPTRAPVDQYEIQHITSVRAQFARRRDKVPVYPLYGIPEDNGAPRQSRYYTSERESRFEARHDRQFGRTQSGYLGTDTWLTHYEPPDQDGAVRILVSTLCSNRDLPDLLPVADGEFGLIDDTQVKFSVATMHSPPREAVVALEEDAPHRMTAGDNYWRLISFLALSQRGFLGTDGAGNVAALKELLRLFSDVSDQASEDIINAITNLSSRPVTRTIERPEGFFAARGMEVLIEFDDEKIDAAACICLSAVLDWFLADHATINTFTQCVATNRKGHRLKVWPPRDGTGPLL